MAASPTLAVCVALAAVSAAQSPSAPPRHTARVAAQNATAPRAPTVSTRPGALPTSQVTAALEQVLRRIPEDASAVLVIPALDDLAANIAAFGKTIAVRDIAEATGGDLAEGLLGRSAALLDTAGPLVLALGPDYDEPLLLAAALSPPPKAGGKTSPFREGVLLHDFGPEHYLAATGGGVAIFARERADLRRALESRGELAGRLLKGAGDLLAGRQVIAYVELPAWQDKLQNWVSFFMRTVLVGMSTGEPNTEMALQIIGWARDRLTGALADTQTIAAALQINASGVFFESRVTFKPGAELAAYLRGIRRSERDLLRGLAAEDASIMAGWEWEETSQARAERNSLMHTLLKMESMREKLGAEKIDALLKRTDALSARVPGTSFAARYDPVGKGLLYWGVYLTSAPREAQAELRELYEQTPELMNALGTAPTCFEPRTSEPVAGVTADLFGFKEEGTTSRRAAQPSLQAMYGKQPTLYLAPQTEGVAYAIGSRPIARRKLAEQIEQRAGAAPGTRVQAALERLAPHPQIAIMVDLVRTAADVLGFADQLGLPVPPVELPSEPAPLAAVGVYLDPELLRIQTYVPATPVRTLRDALGAFMHEPPGARAK